MAAPASNPTLLVELLLSGPGSAGAPCAVRCVRDLLSAAPAEPVDAAPFSHGFTGRHDSGALPAAPANAYGHVLAAVAEAKAASDVLLRAMLPPAGAGAGAGAAAPMPLAKKARLVGDADEAEGGEGGEG